MSTERFVDLMRRYADLKVQHDQVREKARELREQYEQLRELLRVEAQNIGIGKGTKMRFDGVGTFSFTSKKHYHVPKVNRGEFARLLASRDEYDLLTINTTDLRDWCDDLESADEALPGYVKIIEDKFVPHITLARGVRANTRSNE